MRPQSNYSASTQVLAKVKLHSTNVELSQNTPEGIFEDNQECHQRRENKPVKHLSLAQEGPYTSGKITY